MGGCELRRALGFSLALGSILLAAGCDRSTDVDKPIVSTEAGSSVRQSGPASLDRARQPGSSSASLAPVDIGDGAISWPRVTGLSPAAAERINAVLDRRHEAAVAARKECREIAQGRETRYSSRAEERYNRNGLLSFRITAEAFCGGASGTTIADAVSFDLKTGREIDIAGLINPKLPQIAERGHSYYSGSEGCALFLRDQREFAEPEALFIDSQGLGVIYAFNAGAAERCANRDAIIPIKVIRRTVRLGGPLSRAWTEAPPSVTAPRLGTLSLDELDDELGTGLRCTLQQDNRILLGAKRGDAVAILDGNLVRLENAPIYAEGLYAGGTYHRGSTTIAVSLSPSRGEGDTNGRTFNKPADATITRGNTIQRLRAVWTCSLP